MSVFRWRDRSKPPLYFIFILFFEISQPKMAVSGSTYRGTPVHAGCERLMRPTAIAQLFSLALVEHDLIIAFAGGRHFSKPRILRHIRQFTQCLIHHRTARVDLLVSGRSGGDKGQRRTERAARHDPPKPLSLSRRVSRKVRIGDTVDGSRSPRSSRSQRRLAVRLR